MEKNRTIAILGVAAILALLGLKALRIIDREGFESIPFINLALSVLFMIVGGYIILMVHEKNQRFVNDFRYRLFRKMLGEKGVVLFYYILGIVMIILGIKIAT